MSFAHSLRSLKIADYLQWRTAPEPLRWTRSSGSSAAPRTGALPARSSIARTENCAGYQRWWCHTAETGTGTGPWAREPPRAEPNPCVPVRGTRRRRGGGTDAVPPERGHL